jgi:hypothetical protein
MAFKKGQSGNKKGRTPGVPNHLTTSAKEAFMYAFNNVGGQERLAKYARTNYSDFIKIFSRIIPQDINTKGTDDKKEFNVTVTFE